MKKRKFSILILLFVLMFTFVGCNKQNANEGDKQTVEIPNEVLNMDLSLYQNEVTKEEFYSKLKKYSDGFKERDYISNEYNVTNLKATAKEHQSISGVYEHKAIRHGVYKIDFDSKIETYSMNGESKKNVNSTYKNEEETTKQRVDQVYQKHQDRYCFFDLIEKKIYSDLYYPRIKDFFEFKEEENIKYYVDGNVFTTITEVENPGYKNKHTTITQKIYNNNEFILLDKRELNEETSRPQYFEDIIMSDYIEHDFSKKIIKFEDQKLKPVDVTGYTFAE